VLKDHSVNVNQFSGNLADSFRTRIGTEVSGQFAMPNGQNGVEIYQSGKNVILGNWIGTDA
jgi:hypothetical protein